MTPVPLELPLRPAEAAEIGSLIFEHAERKPLTPDLRNRLAARTAALKLETITPHFGSLSRDPVHPNAYYLAVDAADGEPLLLYIGLSAAPTSSIFHRSLLIGRMRRTAGPEMVINSTPFGPRNHDHIERFAAQIDTAFLPRPQGSRASITIGSNFPAAFSVFRAIHKRTGKNLAALSGNYHAGVWAAIRAGWRLEYSAVANTARDTLAYTRFTGTVSTHEEIRSGRNVEFEVGVGDVTPEELAGHLEFLKAAGHAPQFVTVSTAGDIEGLAAVARLHRVTLSFRYAGESPATLQRIAAATQGRFNYQVDTPEEAETIAEYL